MMMVKSKIMVLTVAWGLAFLFFACDEAPHVKNTPTPEIVSGKISLPIVKDQPEKGDKKTDTDPKNNSLPELKSALKPTHQAVDQKVDKEKDAHYLSQGKIDPFRPLIQEKPEKHTPIVDNRPKRILTPLEKIELSQIRLVAVITMKDRQIAMVEEANGKGYEVGIGTYIGKNQGRISEIKNNSIVIKALIKDYAGRLKEQVQEIKLHKNDNEE
ncbi:pilus assembly protein PilP [Desulfobacula sp.]|uniref:pilus assembly protein PilP n=1 Tax=Desulfobacula sp. TaxID=2593537 RepID=UPI002612975B|nr:pilus assembly protein PilP [Desulfobacula sp.]